MTEKYESNELCAFFENNNINLNSFLSKTHNKLMIKIFEKLVLDMHDINVKRQIRNRIRNSCNRVLTIKNIIYNRFSLTITNAEAVQIMNYLYAYFNKKNTRISIENISKLDILKKQDFNCAICNGKIDLETSEIDHIIPWVYVGDELQDNYQMLCRTCNRKKCKSIDYDLNNYLINV